jgi:hypothetical protein
VIEIDENVLADTAPENVGPRAAASEELNVCTPSGVVEHG